MSDVVELLTAVVEPAQVIDGAEASEDYHHDEALNAPWSRPDAVVTPTSTDDVVAVLEVCAANDIPVTARGSGTGLSGACIPRSGGVVISFEKMTRILEIDARNHTATVQPGVTLQQLDDELSAHGLVYPVFPGEYSASLGGNVNTNAGGMRAVKYGVTRHHVLGIEAVLATGDVIRCGGKIVKATTGYDLTQLIIGSEGTLAIVTEATLKLHPRLPHAATILAPFATLGEVTEAVPEIVGSGLAPQILEYIDLITMAAMTEDADLDLGVPDDIRNTALAYLVVVLESAHEDRLDADVEALGMRLTELGALDAYVLPPGAAAQIIEARERAFWLAKGKGANDIVDVVVPRASIPEFMEAVQKVAGETESWVAGCGHAGDGNVHLSVFQSDPVRLKTVMTALYAAGMAVGGAISGEHGLGTEKRPYFLELEDPAKIDLMRRIKSAFDPAGILNPGAVF